VSIKFDSITGHNYESLWFVSFDGTAHYGIRVGSGFHVDYIENVTIFGEGKIDLNISNNIQPSLLVADIPSCILVHGRVRNTLIKDITLSNAHRTIMVYGDNDGVYNLDGSVTGGTSYDLEYLDILNTKSFNSLISGYGILLGHPMHRGSSKYIRCNDNFLDVGNTQLEPNFMLSEFELLRNVIV